MKRRDSIKTMFLGSLGATLTLKSCITSEDKLMLDQVWQYNYGRTYEELKCCLLYTSPSPRDATLSRMPSSA